jgi:hypothetical protein
MKEEGESIMSKEVGKRKHKRVTALIAVAAVALTVMIFPMPASAATDAPTTAEVEFTAGDLELTGAPDLDFGVHEISNTQENYAAESLPDPIEVTDLRGGNTGWKLTASLSKFQTGGNDSLVGSYITISNLVISAENGTVGAGPTQAGSKLDSDGTSSVKILSAAAGNGNGVWQAAPAQASTTLTVFPGTASVGAHEATINWSIEDTP